MVKVQKSCELLGWKVGMAEKPRARAKQRLFSAQIAPPISNAFALALRHLESATAPIATCTWHSFRSILKRGWGSCYPMLLIQLLANAADV